MAPYVSWYRIICSARNFFRSIFGRTEKEVGQHVIKRRKYERLTVVVNLTIEN